MFSLKLITFLVLYITLKSEANRVSDVKNRMCQVLAKCPTGKCKSDRIGFGGGPFESHIFSTDVIRLEYRGGRFHEFSY